MPRTIFVIIILSCHRTFPYMMCVCVLSCVWLSVTPWTVAHQASLSMGFSREEHWSGLPFPSSGILPDPGIEPASVALAGGLFAIMPPGKPESLLGLYKSELNFHFFNCFRQVSLIRFMRSLGIPTFHKSSSFFQ